MFSCFPGVHCFHNNNWCYQFREHQLISKKANSGHRIPSMEFFSKKVVIDFLNKLSRLFEFWNRRCQGGECSLPCEKCWITKNHK